LYRRFFALTGDASPTSRPIANEMLRIFVGALRLCGAPDLLYLDNGATYAKRQRKERKQSRGKVDW
jgi:hypothetical protein